MGNALPCVHFGTTLRQMLYTVLRFRRMGGWVVKVKLLKGHTIINFCDKEDSLWENDRGRVRVVTKGEVGLRRKTGE